MEGRGGGALGWIPPRLFLAVCWCAKRQNFQSVAVMDFSDAQRNRCYFGVLSQLCCRRRMLCVRVVEAHVCSLLPNDVDSGSHGYTTSVISQ